MIPEKLYRIFFLILLLSFSGQEVFMLQSGIVSENEIELEKEEVVKKHVVSEGRITQRSNAQKESFFFHSYNNFYKDLQTCECLKTTQNDSPRTIPLYLAHRSLLL